MHHSVDEHQVEKRSFAFSLAYIKCFLAYSLSLSLRLPAQILYAGIHLPPQREVRALPRRALSRRFVNLAQGEPRRLRRKPQICKGARRASYAEGVLHVPQARFI